MKKGILAVLLVLAGCGEALPDTVGEYLQDTLQMQKAELKEIMKIEDESGHTDTRYTLKAPDGVEFRVLSDVTEGLDGETEYLRDDYRYSALEQTVTDLRVLRIEAEKDAEGMHYAELYGAFSSKEELRELCEEAQRVTDGHMLVNIRFSCTDRTLCDADEQNAYRLFTQQDAEDVQKKYLYVLMELCRDDLLSGYGEEELLKAAQESGHRILYGDPENPSLTRTLIGSPDYRGLSFVCVYRLLKEDGLEVEGSPQAFSVRTEGGILAADAKKPDRIVFDGQEYVLQNEGHLRTMELRVLTGRFYAEQYEAEQGWDLWEQEAEQ